MPNTAVANSRVLGLSLPKVSKLRKEQYLELAHKAALLASSLNTLLCTSDIPHPYVNDMCLHTQAEKLEVLYQLHSIYPSSSLVFSTPLSQLKVPYQVAQRTNNVKFTASPQENCGIIWHFCRRHASWSWSLSKTSLWKPSMVTHVVISSFERLGRRITNLRQSEPLY